jgi:hypothetical protein
MHLISDWDNLETGILAGALPTAKTVIGGVELITPKLMVLGFATGKAAVHDHLGILLPSASCILIQTFSSAYG